MPSEDGPEFDLSSYNITDTRAHFVRDVDGVKIVNKSGKRQRVLTAASTFMTCGKYAVILNSQRKLRLAGANSLSGTELQQDSKRKPFVLRIKATLN